MDVRTYMHEAGRRARAAAHALARADTAVKNQALIAIAAAIRRDADRITAANAEDVAEAVMGILAQDHRALASRVELRPFQPPQKK